MEMVLQAFHRVNTHSRTYDRGHTLEHAFSPVPGAMERTGALGLGVTLQHALVYSLAGNMQSYWGQQRAADCTPARAWLDSGVLVGAGTDSPVTHYDPWLNIYGFATRDTRVAGVLGPQHRIAVAEALRAYTVGSARILGWDNALGMLAPGKVADCICLDRDPLAVPVDQVRHVRVTRTIVHGRQVFPVKERQL
jgi:predicted amidohydrolase YtcJ